MHLRGSWKIGAGPLRRKRSPGRSEHPEVRSVRFDSAGLQSWDSGLPFISGVGKGRGSRGSERSSRAFLKALSVS